MNTSNNVIFMSNNNSNLPEIPQKKTIFLSIYFYFAKITSILFFLSSYQQVTLQRLYLLVIIKNQIGLYKY